MEEQIQKPYVEASYRRNLRCRLRFRHSRFGSLDQEIFKQAPCLFCGGSELSEENGTDCIGFWKKAKKISPPGASAQARDSIYFHR